MYMYMYLPLCKKILHELGILAPLLQDLPVKIAHVDRGYRPFSVT